MVNALTRILWKWKQIQTDTDVNYHGRLLFDLLQGVRKWWPNCIEL